MPSRQRLAGWTRKRLKSRKRLSNSQPSVFLSFRFVFVLFFPRRSPLHIETIYQSWPGRQKKKRNVPGEYTLPPKSRLRRERSASNEEERGRAHVALEIPSLLRDRARAYRQSLDRFKFRPGQGDGRTRIGCARLLTEARSQGSVRIAKSSVEKREVAFLSLAIYVPRYVVFRRGNTSPY